MRHKTSGYFLLSALLVSLILGLCILLNLRCPQAVSDGALTQEQLTLGVTLTGWQQTGPGHWRFAFEAPADVPELVLCLSTRSLDAVPEGLEPTDQRGEAFWVRPVPGRTSEITVTSTTVPQMWLMLPDTLALARTAQQPAADGACGFCQHGCGHSGAVLLQAQA